MKRNYFLSFLLSASLLVAFIIPPAQAARPPASSSFVALEWLLRTAQPVIGVGIELRLPGRLIEIGGKVSMRLPSTKRVVRRVAAVSPLTVTAEKRRTSAHFAFRVQNPFTKFLIPTTPAPDPVGDFSGGGSGGTIHTATSPPPAAPSNIVLTVHDSETIIVKWDDNASDEVTTRIERKTGAGGTYVEIGYVYANWFRFPDDSLTPGTTYFYRARARNASGDSAYATEQSAATSAAPTPSASLSAPSTAFTAETVLVDARLSTGICRRPQANGDPSITIDFGDGFTATDNPVASHAYLAAGSYVISVGFKNCAGTQLAFPPTIEITVSDIPACSGGACRTAVEQGTAAANLIEVQAHVDAAAAANTVEQEVIIPKTMVLNGPLILPTPAGSKYITIRSGSASLPPRKKRITPADTAEMPIIQARTSQGYPANVAIQTPYPAPSSPPHHWRILGLHFKKDSSATAITTLGNIGQDGSGGGQDSIAKIAHHFIVERCWFDGDESVDTSQINTGLRIYGNYVTVMDSYLSPFRLIGAGVDTSAISVSAGQGPLSFVNNVMVAGSENFSLSGGPTEVNSATITSPTITSATLFSTTNLAVDQSIALPVGGKYNASHSTIVRSISGGNITFDPIHVAPDAGTAKWSATPSFIEFRRNYLYKSLCWRSTDPCYNNQNTQIKNLWESKFHRYLHMEGNLLRWTWIKDQDYAVVIAPRNINGGNSETAVIRSTVLKDNIIQDAAKGITLQSGDGTDYSGSGCPPACSPVQRQTDVILRNNLFRNVGVNWDGSGAGHQMILLQGAADQDNPVRIQMKRVFGFHNTWDNGTPSNENMAFSDFGDVDQQSGCFGCAWLDNTSQGLGYGWKSNASLNSATNLINFFPPGDTSNWNKNLVVNGNGLTYPSPGAIEQTATWTSAVFADYANGNFTLQGGSSGKNAALDGSDTGINVTSLKTAIGASTAAFGTATINTVTGDWTVQAGSQGVQINGKVTFAGKVTVQ